ncbi:MAG TPA: FAD-binding oxidoreductase [Actinophytocola sp.]|uniref:FAD-binding oxidoreductase n=1 Tax=Actinophytocola sp. TaxID=1872138 RepID=UPI002DBA1B52|nr:FAD-binding oxidoreductase [Actinophytocola sp.]HEU5473535.1 FAD-binding oxidoreductase [Actinophytocola sp.]
MRPAATSAFETLAAEVDGPVYLPGTSEYAEEIDGFDRSVRHRPTVVVGATSAADVVAAVRFARDNDLGVAVQNTGHGVALPADKAVFISTRRMTGHEVDARARTARIEAGVTWDDVVDSAAKHGLAPLNGSAPFVGATSYTLGGGVGVLARKYGYAADHVRWLDVVTADGELLRASESEHPDLFWALRGGKGNFGVVTAMAVELFEVSRLYGGGLFFPAESTPRVLHTYREWVTGVPEDMSTSFVMIPFPELDFVPEPLRGKFATHIRVAYLGSAEEGARLIQPLRDVGPRLLDTVEEMPYSKVGTIHNDPPTAGSYYINTFQLTGLEAGTVDTVLELAGPDADGTVMVEIRQLGGALARPPKVPNAVAHRDDVPFQVYAASVLGNGQDDVVLTAHARLVDRLSRWDSGHRMLNFMAGIAHTDPSDVRDAFTDEAYTRLVALKTRYDPGNMFRFNHNIPPAPGKQRR